MMMPVLGGVPTMRELVKINPDVRIIAASGIHDNESDREIDRPAGAAVSWRSRSRPTMLLQGRVASRSVCAGS